MRTSLRGPFGVCYQQGLTTSVHAGGLSSTCTVAPPAPLEASGGVSGAAVPGLLRKWQEGACAHTWELTPCR